MRKALLAACLVALPVTSFAQVQVQDQESILQQIKSYEQELKSWVLENTQELHEAATDLQTGQIYAQEMETYLHFVENPTLANAMGLLNSVGLGSDLPANPLQVMSLANGFVSMGNGGSLAGDLSRLQMLSGFASSSFAANHVYTCTGTDQACVNLNARANGIAGSMGLTQTTYADIQAHQATLQALRDDLAGTTDPAKRETITAQIGVEQAYLLNTAGKLQAAAQQAALAQQSAQQRTLEMQRQSADAYFAATAPLNSTAQVVANTAQPDTLPPLFSAN